MLHNTETEQNLVQRIQLSQAYQDFLQGICGADFKRVLDEKYTFCLNQLLLEQELREGKISTDALRGRLQMINLLYEHINYKILDMYKANEMLVKLKGKE
jgi:hypothetical protein